jgi:hypothetical protein
LLIFIGANDADSGRIFSDTAGEYKRVQSARCSRECAGRNGIWSNGTNGQASMAAYKNPITEKRFLLPAIPALKKLRDS